MHKMFTVIGDYELSAGNWRQTKSPSILLNGENKFTCCAAHVNEYLFELDFMIIISLFIIPLLTYKTDQRERANP